MTDQTRFRRIGIQFERSALKECRTTILSTPVELTQADFQHLLQLRTGLRRFLRWSEQQAHAAGLTSTQHQLLLAIRGHPGEASPTIGEIADYLVLRHHSASE